MAKKGHGGQASREQSTAWLKHSVAAAQASPTHWTVSGCLTSADPRADVTESPPRIQVHVPNAPGNHNAETPVLGEKGLFNVAK
mgnify:CR=1 FL=1